MSNPALASTPSATTDRTEARPPPPGPPSVGATSSTTGGALRIGPIVMRPKMKPETIMTYRGRMDHGVVVLEGERPPDGTVVEVTPVRQPAPATVGPGLATHAALGMW